MQLKPFKLIKQLKIFLYEFKIKELNIFTFKFKKFRNIVKYEKLKRNATKQDSFFCCVFSDDV